MDIAGVALTQSQSLDRSEHLFHRRIGIGHDAGGEEQSIDAALALERGKGRRQVVWFEGGALALNRAGGKAVFAKILVTLQSPDCSRSMHACALLPSIAQLFNSSGRV